MQIPEGPNPERHTEGNLRFSFKLLDYCYLKLLGTWTIYVLVCTLVQKKTYIRILIVKIYFIIIHGI